MSIQVVFFEGIAHRNVGGRYVHLIDADTPGSRRNGDHLIILVGAVVLGIEALVCRAVRVVSLAHTTRVFHSIGSKDVVTPNSLLLECKVSTCSAIL